MSCISASVCTAVGYAYNSTGTQVTLAQGWNGTIWTIQATPNPSGTSGNALNGVSCTSASACIATGYSGNSIGVSRTLAERYATGGLRQ